MINTLMPSLQSGDKKPLWQQKGGTFATVVLAGLILLVVINAPKLLFLFQSTLYAILTLCGIGIVVFLLTNKQFRMALSVGYFIFMKKLLGIFVEMMPDKILDRRIAQMEKNTEDSKKAVGKLYGIKMELSKKLKTKEQKIADNANAATAFRKRNDKNRALLAEREMSRQTNLANMYVELLNSVSKWYITLQKLTEMADLTVEDAKNEVEALKEQYKIASISYNAYKSAMSAMKGDPDEAALFQSAMDKMTDDISSKLGEMELVLNETSGIINKIDVQKEVMSIQGSQLLEKYEKLGLDGILNKFETLPSGKIQNIQDVAYEPITVSTALPQGKSKYFDI
jgi:phage shock protein A